MFEVAIIGAGELGGAIAHRLATRDLVPAVRLVDAAGSIAQGKALDIMQSSPIEGFSTRVTGVAELAFASSAALIVIAERAAGGEWNGEDGLALLRGLHSAGAPLIVCAGASQRELIERAARELGVSRTRILGSAPEALASALRATVALETNRSRKDVALSVLGVPPSHIVVPWEDATIGGLSAASMLDTPLRRRLEARVAHLWPPGPHALAAAAVKAIEAIVGLSRQMVSSFVAPDDSAGRRSRAAAFPVRLGAGGVVEVMVPLLTPHDRVALDTAVLL